MGGVEHDEATLSQVLVEFATTLTTDYPIQEILDRLVNRIVDVLPIAGAGITLISPEQAPHYVAASSEAALRFERMQTEISEGPCRLAFDLDEAVAFPDLDTDDRVPRFASAAVEGGLAAVFAFPLRHGDRKLGALDLYREAPGELDAGAMRAGQTLADVAAAYLTNAESRLELRAAVEHLQHSSLHDPLTGLPNRLLLRERLQHAAERATRTHTSAAVLFADLDRFKQVNDVYGHHVGDELLLAVAQRLSALVRPGDTLARVSGDEFVLLCEDLRDADDVAALTRRIDRAFAEPFHVEGIELSITVSVGVVFAGPGEEITEELVVLADQAMYEVKRRGGVGSHTVDLRQPSEGNEWRRLERDLRHALEREELEVVYQPIVRCADEVVTGMEALLRWKHPERGEIPARAVLGIAEASGLVRDVGGWALDQAFRQRDTWCVLRPDIALDLSVNISLRRLLGRDLVASVAATLADTGMDPAALIFEIDDDVFGDSERSEAALSGLKSLGVRLALDDFGAGRSPLADLRRFPLEMVKIDRSFVAGVAESSEQYRVLASLIDLVHAFGLTTVVQGVETDEQAAAVRAMGSDGAQGTRYGPPMPASAVEAFLARATRLA